MKENKGIVQFLLIGGISACILLFAFLTTRQILLYYQNQNNTAIVEPSAVFTETIMPESSEGLGANDAPSIGPDNIDSTEQPAGTFFVAPEKSPSPTDTPFPTSTPMVITSTNPGVSISIIDSGLVSPTESGEVRIQFMGGNEPLRGIEVGLYIATQDIVGKWTIIEKVYQDTGSLVNSETDQNGLVEGVLSPGTYAIWNEDYTASWNQLNGIWGIDVLYFNYTDPSQAIIFPVFPGKTTEIVVSLARLEIGVIDQNGNAVKNSLVYVGCQRVDVANQKIAIDCGDGINYNKTDNTGLVTFNLGPGTYVICVSAGDFYCFYDIEVKTGEARREILELGK